jgi:hypothetical protein
MECEFLTASQLGAGRDSQGTRYPLDSSHDEVLMVILQPHIRYERGSEMHSGRGDTTPVTTIKAIKFEHDFIIFAKSTNVASLSLPFLLGLPNEWQVF